MRTLSTALDSWQWHIRLYLNLLRPRSLNLKQYFIKDMYDYAYCHEIT